VRFLELKARWCGRKAPWLFRVLPDRRGVSAVEFALIAPVLIGFYVGAIEIGDALTIHRRTSAVASVAADLTAQVKTVANADLADITAAATSILYPYVPPNFPAPKIVLTSVVADANNTTKVCWSYATNGGSARGTNSVVSLPPGLTQANSSVIMAEVTYAYTPLLNLTGYANPGAFTMSRTFYARPRKSLTVTKTDQLPKC
jgi:Flp pilus assembly protein TadG